MKTIEDIKSNMSTEKWNCDQNYRENKNKFYMHVFFIYF